MLNLALWDALLLIGSYNLLFWHRFGRWAGLTGSIGTLILVWLSASYLLGRYSRPDQGQRDSQRGRLIRTLLVGGLVLALVVVVFSWGLKLDDPRTFRSFVVPVLGVATLCSALAQLWVTRRQTKPRRWLLVGSAQELAVLEQELASPSQTNSSKLYTIFYTSERLNKAALSNDQPVDGIAVSELCTLEDDVVEELLARRGHGAMVCSLVSWCEQHLQRVPPELFSSRWLVQAEGFELQPGRWGWRVKRMGDVVVAATLLLISSPVLLLAALAIKLEDGGPVLYSQVRTGLYGEPYRIWKLRSMRPNAEADGAQWAGNRDPRITCVGQWLRQLRLDELPQLVAVLRGEMSLIGPRPERPELEVNLEDKIPHYRVRHWIRPGLSGWAQVCFPYGASLADSRAKLSYDLCYLRNASLLLDLLILLKTIRLISRRQGAHPNEESTIDSPNS
jgi:exopolysaccharide biosynthesis polyprenyl glycosylphosphotransferase